MTGDLLFFLHKSPPLQIPLIFRKRQKKSYRDISFPFFDSKRVDLHLLQLSKFL